jgi:2-oxoglutarate ferredoxin oxidoreductase subunit alpha
VRGFPTSRPDEVDPFIRRLFRKVSQNFADLQIGEHFHVDDADVAIIAYGVLPARRSVPSRTAGKRG